VVCNDNNDCTIDSCDPAIGCKTSLAPGCCVQASDCNDGYACNTDACVNGKCTHGAVSCSTGAPCTLSYCQGGACTNVASTAVSSPVVIYSETFDDQLAQGVVPTTKNPSSFWSVQSKRANSAPSALYGGNPQSFTYDVGTSDFQAAFPPIWLPAGKLKLRFNVWMQVQENNCFADILYVGVNGTALQPFVCESTGGAFKTVEYDISSFGGKVGFLTFFFQTYDPTENQGEGVYIDDVVITAEPNDGCP
jgi:hypothetical protein